MLDAGSKRVWTVAEAKARLSEILRLAEEEGPQRSGARKPFIVVPAAAWEGEGAAPQASGPVAGREHAARHESRRADGGQVAGPRL